MGGQAFCPSCKELEDDPIVPGTYEGDVIISSGRASNGSVVTFTAEESITLNPGFEAEAGADFTAQIQAVSAPTAITRNYLGEIEYYNGQLEAIYHEEGRAIPNGSTYEYHYAIRDHLGSTRVLFKMVSGTATIIQENHYYPFGMEMEGVFAAGSNKYRYNGKELNEEFGLGWYDYGARWYNASIGRWNAVDPLAEEYASISPFVYANNNPIKYIDPNGMYFTERSMEYLNRLYENMNRSLASYNRRIAKAEEKGKTDRVSKLTSRRDQLVSEFKEIHQEIGELSRSDQAYDIYLSDKYSDSGPMPGLGTKRGGATFNFSTGVFEIVLPKGNNIGFITHELKHAFQFEKGKYSVGPEVIGGYKNVLYDKTDEVEAYERGSYFGQTKYSLHNLPRIYDRVQTGPVDITSHPNLKHILNVPIDNQVKAFQGFANTTGHAFRVNGKTYYRKR